MNSCKACGNEKIMVCPCCSGEWGENEMDTLRARVATLEESIRFNEDQRRMLFDSATTLEADRDRWKAIAEKRHEILLNLEWSSYDHDDEGYGSYCPCCMNMDDEVHVAGCKMAEAIAESARAANGEVKYE